MTLKTKVLYDGFA